MNQPQPLQHDRGADDVGNLVLLEHYNCFIDDQRLATLFYVTGLGGTRDPYLFTGLDNMWVNFGRTQVHLPSPAGAVPQRLRGRAGMVVPDLKALQARLELVERQLQRMLPGVQHRFSFTPLPDCIEATCPWGNRVRCHAPGPEWGPTELGLAYLEFDVPPGSAEGIARFYRDVMRAPARTEAGTAVVSVGTFQSLRFTESDLPAPEYDGHHFAVYLADFSSPYRWLREHGLISRDSDPHEWRLEWICDPADGRKLFQVEHEVRSLKHPLYQRKLVNRDGSVTNLTFAGNNEAFRGRD